MRSNFIFVLPLLALLLGAELFAVEQEELVKAPVVSLEFFHLTRLSVAEQEKL